MNLNNTNSKVASKALTPAVIQPEKFFQQFIALPPVIHGGLFQIIGLQDSGITPRDYFAAHVIGSSSWENVSFESSREFAEWAYRVADAMLKARAIPVGESPDGSSKNSGLLPE